MNKTEVKKELFDFLTPFLTRYNFKPDKGNDRFVQKTSVGFCAISYHLVQRSNFIEVLFYAHVRFDSIEDKWHSVSLTNPKFQKTSTTIILGMNVLEGADFKSFRVVDKTSCEEGFR